MEKRIVSMGQGWLMETAAGVWNLAWSKRRSKAPRSSLGRDRRNSLHLSRSSSNIKLKGIGNAQILEKIHNSLISNIVFKILPSKVNYFESVTDL